MATMVYAGFWRRFLAHMIDAIIVTIAYMIVLMIFGLSIGGLLAGKDLVKAANQRKIDQKADMMGKDPAASGVTYQYTPQANEMVITQTANAAAAATPTVINEPVAAPAASTTIDTPMPAEVVPVSPASPVASMPIDQGAAPQEAPSSYSIPAEASSSASSGISPAPSGSASVPSYTAAGDSYSIDDETQTEHGAWFMAFVYIIIYGSSALYHSFFVSSAWQATPGKRVMGCVVVTREGKRLTFWHAFGRHCACALSGLTLLIGYFLAGWTREKTALHDMVANTRVVRVANADPVIATR